MKRATTIQFHFNGDDILIISFMNTIVMQALPAMRRAFRLQVQAAHSPASKLTQVQLRFIYFKLAQTVICRSLDSAALIALFLDVWITSNQSRRGWYGFFLQNLLNFRTVGAAGSNFDTDFGTFARCPVPSLSFVCSDEPVQSLPLSGTIAIVVVGSV